MTKLDNRFVKLTTCKLINAKKQLLFNNIKLQDNSRAIEGNQVSITIVIQAHHGVATLFPCGNYIYNVRAKAFFSH